MLYSNSLTICKYLRPVDAILIRILITYFTTDRVLLSTFVLSVINNISTTPKIPSSIEKIVDRFLFPTIDPIIGTPDYESIADIHLKLDSNSASVQSNLGCGTLGLLFLKFSTAVYATLSTIAFVPPVNPGPEPSIPIGATGAVIAGLRYHHTESTNIFTEYKNTDKALCRLLLASTYKLYVQSLRHK